MGENSGRGMLEMLFGFCFKLEGKRRERAAKERANIAAAFWLSVVDDCDGCLVMGTEAMVKAQCLVDTFFFSPMLSGGTAWSYISWTRLHPSCLPHGYIQQPHFHFLPAVMVPAR